MRLFLFVCCFLVYVSCETVFVVCLSVFSFASVSPVRLFLVFVWACAFFVCF